MGGGGRPPHRAFLSSPAPGPKTRKPLCLCPSPSGHGGRTEAGAVPPWWSGQRCAHLPSLEIREGALDDLLEHYCSNLDKIGGDQGRFRLKEGGRKATGGGGGGVLFAIMGFLKFMIFHLIVYLHFMFFYLLFIIDRYVFFWDQEMI